MEPSRPASSNPSCAVLLNPVMDEPEVVNNGDRLGALVGMLPDAIPSRPVEFYEAVQPSVIPLA